MQAKVSMDHECCEHPAPSNFCLSSSHSSLDISPSRSERDAFVWAGRREADAIEVHRRSLRCCSRSALDSKPASLASRLEISFSKNPIYCMNSQYTNMSAKSPASLDCGFPSYGKQALSFRWQFLRDGYDAKSSKALSAACFPLTVGRCVNIFRSCVQAVHFDTTTCISSSRD